GVRLGKRDAAVALEHRALLVDRPALRPVLPPSGHAPGNGSPRPASAQHAADLRRLLPALAAALHLRAPGAGRLLRLDVRCADGLRQAVQPGALAAHRPAGGDLGDVRPAHPWPAAARPAAWLDGADRPVGADHLATPLYRRTYGNLGRLAMRLAVADRGPQPAAAAASGPRAAALAPGP